MHANSYEERNSDRHIDYLSKDSADSDDSEYQNPEPPEESSEDACKDNSDNNDIVSVVVDKAREIVGDTDYLDQNSTQAGIKVNQLQVTASIPAESRNRHESDEKRVLLLQGPIGPFFKNLQSTLVESGFLTKRILFHKADGLFAPKNNVFRFCGDLNAWESWLRTELHYAAPNVIVLFGSSRPAHIIARRLAKEFNVDVVALEEGYLRSGYITCEIGGNNSHSPLTQWESDMVCDSPTDPLKIPYSFSMMCLWGSIFYIWRELTKDKLEQQLYHRTTNGALKETCSWTAHTVRRNFARLSDSFSMSELQSRFSKKFILIPLQTPSDAQIRFASRGWCNEKLVTACLKAIGEIKSEEILVFKTHPLDVQSNKLTAMINLEAKKRNIAHRVRILQSGSVSKIASHCSGMIVINSTSAFSALNCNVPLLVLGDAVFCHSSVVTTGKDENAIKKFFVSRSTKDQKSIASFIKAVRSTALIPGDYYALSPQTTTARNVVSTIERHINRNTNRPEISHYD